MTAKPLKGGVKKPPKTNPAWFTAGRNEAGFRGSLTSAEHAAFHAFVFLFLLFGLFLDLLFVAAVFTQAGIGNGANASG
jgi:hypothetical protein